jgi:Skp family chaperone for outer membrane proteins
VPAEGFFVKRTISILSMFAALSVAGVLFAQGPGGAPPTPTAGGRDVAVFNMAKVQKEFQKWDVYTKELQKMRTEEAKGLAAMQSQMLELKKKLEDPLTTQKDVLEKQAVALQRQFQDKDAEVRKKIDKVSTEYLQVLHDDIRRVVDAVAKSNNFGLVMAYPDATTDEERKSPVYFDMKLRPTAAMPFYVSPGNDITDAIVLTLNKFCPPPAGSGVVPTAGTTAPGAPGAGTTAPMTPPRP